MFALRHRELLAQTPGLVEELDGFYKRLSAFLDASFNPDGTLITPPPAQISDLGLAVGTVAIYAGSSVPTGWLLCDGTAVSRSEYRTLFEAIGTAYGAGDGATTFTLPDMQGRFPLGQAASGTGATLGETGGLIDHVHTGPSHTHTSTTVAVSAGAGLNVSTSPTNASGAGSTGTANPPYQVFQYLILAA